ncbi:MAG: hypothetical protein ACOYK6_07940 [Chthoniobacterales bacterium]
MKQRNTLLTLTIASTLSLASIVAPSCAIAQDKSDSTSNQNGNSCNNGAAVHLPPFPGTLRSFKPGLATGYVNPTQDQLPLIGKRFFKDQKAEENKPKWGEDQEHNFVYIGSLEYIWYGENNRAQFVEDWPTVASRLKAAGLPIEDWALGACPWNTKEDFDEEVKSSTLPDSTLDPESRIGKLIALLSQDEAKTVQVQTLVDRLNRALESSHDSSLTPTIFQDLPPGELELLKSNLDAVASVQDAKGHPLGLYALIDYPYFKGEGTAIGEHCNVDGWGLQEVLLNMDPNKVKDADGVVDGPLQAFIDSGMATLDRRIANHRMEADRNNRPVVNDKFNPNSDYAKFWNTWENHLRDYGNWPANTEIE